MGRRRYALEQKEVMVDAGEDLAGWENVVLDGVSLPGARGCVGGVALGLDSGRKRVFALHCCTRGG